MKRANVLRLAAVLAVVVLASMTAGCLKASISLEVELNPEVYLVGDDLAGTMTVVATGVAKGGVYHTLTVDFLDTGNPVNTKATLQVTGLEIIITPWENKSEPFDLADFELAVPEDAVNAANARFTLSGDGFGITPISATVVISVSQPD